MVYKVMRLYNTREFKKQRGPRTYLELLQQFRCYINPSEENDSLSPDSENKN